MRDFTLSKYKCLLEAFINAGYTAITYEQYCTLPSLPDKFVILRHDVDKQPHQALKMAQVEHRLGVQSVYYFRIVAQSNDPSVIRAVAHLGMEIGYHYEDLSLSKGNPKQAEKSFSDNLAYFRMFYPVRTICMHGSVQEKLDNKLLWKYADYHHFGVLAETYLDTNFDDVFYLTDTGRCWDGYKVSVYDKVPSRQAQWLAYGWTYHHTDAIIAALQSNQFPSRLMLTTHPQRWHDGVGAWLYEWIRQHIVNALKYLLIYVFHRI